MQVYAKEDGDLMHSYIGEYLAALRAFRSGAITAEEGKIITKRNSDAIKIISDKYDAIEAKQFRRHFIILAALTLGFVALFLVL